MLIIILGNINNNVDITKVMPTISSQIIPIMIPDSEENAIIIIALSISFSSL